jgi:ribonuclease E
MSDAVPSGPPAGEGEPEGAPRKKRRRGSRGGRNRSRARTQATQSSDARPDDLPDRPIEGRPQNPEVAAEALVPRKPQIGDTRPAPPAATSSTAPDETKQPTAARRRRRGNRSRGGGQGQAAVKPVEALVGEAFELDDETFERRRGRERKGRPVGRYLMCVHVKPEATQIAVLEGRALIEHYVSRPADDVSQIHGNIYLGRVQNVLPGMEAAFVDIGTPKNAVLYRGDVHFDPEDIDEGSSSSGPLRIEQMLKAKQNIVCQVTKNPIGSKGARLSQEVSLPGRFVVLIPNSSTYGISKRLSDDERKRLRAVLDRVKPAVHGIIVRTAAENVTSEEIERDVTRLVQQWERIDALAKRSSAPALLYREPDMAVRVIREEFNADYRGVVIDDRTLYEEVRDYVASISPALADRVEHYDLDEEPLPLFERFHVHEQLHKALDRKVWLPSGGSLIIEHTEALTVIDVNTGKNVGTSSLEETVFRNNLEAAVEVARQLRLRDIGGIIVVDFIDMEIRENRDEVVGVFREALARDKTRTQVFDISELGLVEMTRKRIGEGLLESFSGICPECNGRGVVFDAGLLE